MTRTVDTDTIEGLCAYLDTEDYSDDDSDRTWYDRIQETFWTIASSSHEETTDTVVQLEGAAYVISWSQASGWEHGPAYRATEDYDPDGSIPYLSHDQFVDMIRDSFGDDEADALDYIDDSVTDAAGVVVLRPW